jgi:hypothetical protein
VDDRVAVPPVAGPQVDHQPVAELHRDRPGVVLCGEGLGDRRERRVADAVN